MRPIDSNDNYVSDNYDDYDDYELLPDGSSNGVSNALQMVDNVCGLVNNVSSSLADVSKAVQNTRLQIAQLDNQLNTFIAESKTRLEKFKAAAPILEKQLQNASARIDRITDTILSQSDNSLSEESLKKQALLIDVLKQADDSFNNLLVKLITI